MKIKIMIAALLLLCCTAANAEKYYMVLANSMTTDIKRPALVRYIYDTDNPTAVTPAPAPGLPGATLVETTEYVISGLVYYNGKIYVSCVKTGSVIRFDAYTGKQEAVIATGLVHPAGLIIGADKYMYVACKEYIARYTLAGKPKPGIDNYGDTYSIAGTFRYGDGMVFDKKGNLFVCSQGSGDIIEIDTETGELRRSYARGQGVFSDLARADNGDMYVTATGKLGLDQQGYVGIINRKANTIDNLGLENIKDPYGLAITPDKKLVVTSYSDGQARLYDNRKYLGIINSQVAGERDYRILFYKIKK